MVLDLFTYSAFPLHGDKAFVRSKAYISCCGYRQSLRPSSSGALNYVMAFVVEITGVVPREK